VRCSEKRNTGISWRWHGTRDATCSDVTHYITASSQTSPYEHSKLLRAASVAISCLKEILWAFSLLESICFERRDILNHLEWNSFAAYLASCCTSIRAAWALDAEILQPAVHTSQRESNLYSAWHSGRNNQYQYTFMYYPYIHKSRYTQECQKCWVSGLCPSSGILNTRKHNRPPLWSSGQSSWLQIRRPGFDSRHYQIFWGGGEEESSGSGTGSTQPCEYNWGATW
jgi:hypothetical protein